MSSSPATLPLRPTTLRAPEGINRLFSAGWDADWQRHQHRFGPLPELVNQQALLAELTESGLTGRGGAAFASWKKFSAVLTATERGGPTVSPVVVGNAAEGEPLSVKDRALLRHAPHLVIDGLLLAARMLGTSTVYLALGFEEPAVMEALASRPDGRSIEVVRIPEQFISGEASALLNFIQTGRALPRTQSERLSSSGLRRRPTLVHNIESLAQFALIARYGGAWFRAVGAPDDPGTRLVSISDGVRPAFAVEVPGGAPLAELLVGQGVELDSIGAVLLGGYHGSWVSAESLRETSLGGQSAGAYPAGAGVLWVLRRGQCGLDASAQIMDYLAGQSAKQCGPCRFGLPSAAEAFHHVVVGDRAALTELQGLLDLLPGRGACHHPDGSAAFLASSLNAFSEDLDAHLAGRCLADAR
ncbi:NADH:ubiquinone oxidoreductase subunit F (NADH-binding) [Psychromicrobium silvestre]|uniref:NADH:ubiquinone oxidoreductase subunit F (NADH-binding) n=1 Tax=Psychromicrobium silvestre TaxID=1645614 RepID=A0A7Y9S7M0_9MICC|nr:NADH-ubiquinone oxidoreductase-F iron-sulfur binding region domain-containing protein [Psychromicrobium silvestre]NYE95196.1 NADH:ubiquinone oxidoreductase subunit F (NADH-binding) [Psychromicrobium silvestre]